MKKILLLMALFVGLQAANAQVHCNFKAGLSSPSGDAFEYSKKLGIGYSLDVLYSPNMLLDGQLGFGLEKSGNLMLTASGDWKDKGFDLSASKLGFWGAKANFLLNSDGPSPYGSISLGGASLKSYYIYEDLGPNGLESAKGKLEQTRFAVKPEVGVLFGWFTMGVSWILPTKFTDNVTGHEMKAGAVQYNLGILITIQKCGR